MMMSPNKGFQHDDDNTDSNTLVSTNIAPCVLCTAAEETLLADATNIVKGKVKGSPITGHEGPEGE